MNIVIEILATVITACAGPAQPIAIALPDGTAHTSKWCVERGTPGTSNLTFQAKVWSGGGNGKGTPWVDVLTVRRTTLDGKFVAFSVTQPFASSMRIRVKETNLLNQVMTSKSGKAFKVWPDFDTAPDDVDGYVSDGTVGGPDFIALRRKGTLIGPQFLMFREVFGNGAKMVTTQGKEVMLYLLPKHWEGQ